MNLKPLVNDKTLYEDFLSEIDSRIAAVQKKMEQTNEVNELFRCQGEVRALRSLKMLKEKVNNG